jgi:hypothetical protein
MTSEPLFRSVKPQQTTTYTVISAHDAYCNAVLTVPSVTVYASPIPDFLLGFGDICTGTTATTSLATPPPPDAKITWFTDNGSIVSGQGTSTVQYKAGAIGSAIVGCTFTFPQADRCPTSQRRAVRIDGDPVGKITLSGPTLKTGQSLLFTYTVDNATWYWNLDDSMNDSLALVGVCNHNKPCQMLYTSSHGTGISTISLGMTGFCANKKNVTVTLTIVP